MMAGGHLLISCGYRASQLWGAILGSIPPSSGESATWCNVRRLAGLILPSFEG